MVQATRVYDIDKCVSLGIKSNGASVVTAEIVGVFIDTLRSGGVGPR